MEQKIIKAVLKLIEDLGIENEIRQALGVKTQKVESKVIVPKVQICKGVEKLVEVIKPNPPRLQKTSNGYEIYYDESNGEAVGIVYKNLVFLKKTSSKKITYREAVEYCKTVVINGIESELCPVEKGWEEEFKRVSGNLYLALQEIEAENLDYPTWCFQYNYDYAWNQDFRDGALYVNYNKNKGRFVRPVLILKH